MITDAKPEEQKGDWEDKGVQPGFIPKEPFPAAMSPADYHPFNTYSPSTLPDVFSASSPYATYYHGLSAPSPITHQHTGPAAYSTSQRRTASPMMGYTNLMPSYGSAPSPCHIPTFSDFSTVSRAPTMYGYDPGFMSSSSGTLGTTSGGTHVYAKPPATAYRHHRSPSSPAPETPASHPGSISPPFSIDTSPPTSTTGHSRRPTQESPIINPPFPLASGPGVGIVGGHPFLFGGRGSIDAGMMKDNDREDDEDEDGKGEIGPTRRPRDEVRMDARRARIESEQKRRDELREGFKKLKDALPASGQRASKASLLDRAITHIGQVEAANRYLHEANERLLVENERLRDSNHKLVAAQAHVIGESPLG